MSEFKQVLVYTGLGMNMGQKPEMHSQFGQDWFVASVFGCKKGGTFIDLAANDYKFLSNTLLLERDFGWEGTCIEANKDYLDGLASRQCRTVIAAVGAPKNKKIGFCIQGNRGVTSQVMGGANLTKPCPVTGQPPQQFYLASFREILQAAQAPVAIDYMSLDIEGAETMVMRMFPFDQYTVKLLNIETMSKELEKSLKTNGYEKLRALGPDTWWVHSTMPDLDRIKREYGAAFPKHTCMDDQGYTVNPRWNQVSKWHR